MPTFEAYATVTAALIGFCGVCLTLLWTSNARLKTEVQNQRHARASLLSGLLGELRANKKLLDEHLDSFEVTKKALRKGPRRYRISELRFDQGVVSYIFDGSTEQLVLLDASTVEKVAFAYSTLKSFDDYAGRGFARRDLRATNGQGRPTSSRRVLYHMRKCSVHVAHAITSIESERTALSQQETR